MTSAIINKILHDPLTLLKQKNEEAMAELYLDALRALFGLPTKDNESNDG
jgi:glutamyl-tRNA reductase